MPDEKPVKREAHTASAPQEQAGLKPKEPSALFKNASVKLNTLKDTTKKLRSVFIYSVILIVLIVGVVKIGKFVVQKRRQRQIEKALILAAPTAHRKEKKKEARTPAKAESIPLARQSEPAAVEVAPPQKETTSGIRITLRARENCYVRLKADGKIIFQRILEKSRSETWQAKERIELALGNAAAVELEVNGQVFSNLGRKGQALKTIVITPKGLSIAR